MRGPRSSEPALCSGVLFLMSKRLREYTADHRYLLEVVARQAGFSAPVAIDLNAFYVPLLKTARKGEILPLDGVLVRDWHPDDRRSRPGVSLGLRFYDVEGIRFVSVGCNFSDNDNHAGFYFAAVDRKDYRQLYRIALRCRRDEEPPSAAPVL